MITGEYDKLKEIAKNNVCAKCKSPLEVCWLDSEDNYVLGCGNCGYTDAVTRNLSLTEEFKIGSELPAPIADNIKKRIRRKVMSQVNKPVKNEFAMVPTNDLGTGELLSGGFILALVDYAHKYHLDPYRGHVVIMYGKPYITLDGYLYHARFYGKPYTLQARPMTIDEAKQYKVGDTDHGWIAKVSFTETKEEFTGTGIVTYEEMTAKSPRDQTKLRSPVVAAHPWQLAQKRAEWQALRRAFPIGETKEETNETRD